jgi:cell division protein FtsB
MARKRGRVSHGREVFYIVCLLVVILVSLFGYLGPGGYLELKKTQAELESHRMRVDELNRDNGERFQNIQLLKEDSETLERYARQKGYGRQGDIVRDVPKQDPAKPPPQKRNP